jgi:hypothetical protein
MELYNLSCREPEPSPRAEKVKKYVEEGNSIEKLGEFLHGTFQDDFYEVCGFGVAPWCTLIPLLLLR